MEHPGSSSLPGSFADAFRDAAHYWEKRRLAYNLMLALITLGWLVLTWPHFRPAFTLESLFRLLVLGLIANVPYSLVYLVDLPIQLSSLRPIWLRWRWILWTVGMLLAALLTCYWIADEIYPYVQ